MKFLSIVAAVAVTATGALAQDAFITQVGDDNSAANVQTVRGPGGNVAVIQQASNANSTTAAVNLQRGEFNNAWAYQTVDRVNGAGVAREGSASSLILQTGSDDLPLDDGGFNTAVAVQLQEGRGRAYDMNSQIIQTGDGNTAINWTEARGNAVPSFTATLATPSLSIRPLISTAPGARATVRGAPGARVAIR